MSTAHPPLSPHAAECLLDRLSTDDDFRALFVHDPARALRDVGLDASEAAQALIGPSCMRVQKLASKEEIRRAHDTLCGYLTSAAAHTVVYTFASGNIDQRLTLATNAWSETEAA